MKNIIICIPDFKQGGIPRCLETLLMHIDSNKISVDLFCLNHLGPYKKSMVNCNILEEDPIIHHMTIFTRNISWKNLPRYIPSLFLKTTRIIIKKLIGKDIFILRLKTIGKKISESKNYHAAIAYAEGLASIVVENINCSNKFVWIHNDYAHEGARGGDYLTNFSAFNTICCVSKSTEESFKTTYPKHAHKSTTIYNLINTKFIISQSLIQQDDLHLMSHSYFSIISIGRICAQKNFTCIPEIMSNIKHPVRWYIVGNGPLEEVNELKNKIAYYKMEDKIILLGEKSNPYPYLANSDLFALTSIYESYPTVINEARVLGIPIIANKIPPVMEMLNNQEAIIVNIKEMADAINQLLKSHERLSNLKIFNDFKQHNEKVLQQFYKLLNI